MDISRAYRFRCYPTSEQAALLARTFGCVRYVYNHMLGLRRDAWEQRQESVGYHQTSAALTALKKTPGLEWLGEVSSVPLQQSLRHLQTAFTNFFAKRAKYPSFKSRHDRQAAEYTSSAFLWDGKVLKLAKMDEALPIRFSRTIPAAARVTTVTVSRDAAGRYFVSMLCDDTVQPLPLARAQVGIDLGLTHFATLSSGEKIAAPKALRRHEARLAVLQRRLAKKQRGSRNRAKARRKVARLHAHIADIRQGLPAQALHAADPRKPSDRRRDAGRVQHAREPHAGQGNRGRRLGRAPAPAAVQGAVVRAHARGRRSLVPIEQALQRLRAHGVQDAAVRARVDLPRMRPPPRSR
jgi:putative transposase